MDVVILVDETTKPIPCLDNANFNPLIHVCIKKVLLNFWRKRYLSKAYYLKEVVLIHKH